MRLPKNIGSRGAFNAGLTHAKGTYIMRSDAHCAYAKGYDKTLIENTKENWLVIPRRYSLNEATFDRDLTRPIRDYHYLQFPYYVPMTPMDWYELTTKYKDTRLIDDLMTYQGSCWFANRKYFLERIGKLDDDPTRYGQVASDQLEMGLTYWLGDGEVKINKKTWYAHLSKRSRHYRSGLYERRSSKWDKNHMRGFYWATNHWMKDKEHVKPFSWLIEKFWPIPGWPDNWQETWRNVET